MYTTKFVGVSHRLQCVTELRCKHIVAVGCAGNPCKNGATCVEVGKDYVCQCTEEYEGKTCELGDFSVSVVYIFVMRASHAWKNDDPIILQ